MEYPDDDTLTILCKVGAKKIYAYSNQNNQLQDLELGASGNVVLQSDTLELTGDTIFNSNLVVNGSVFFGDMNVFRTFDDGHTISYGMRISDDEKLQFFKNDSRQNKSVVVNEFGMGTIGANNKTYNEQSSAKINGIYNKAKNVTRRTG